MEQRNWVNPPRKRTPEAQAIVNAEVEAFMDLNPCWYPPAVEAVEPTAKPRPDDRHKFTPLERVDLDYDGRFE